MYDTLIMLRPGATFTVADLHRVVLAVAQSSAAAVEQEGDWVRVNLGKGRLFIHWSSEPHVVVESDEIAERFGAPSQGCRARFEMYGDDPDMGLFNDYLVQVAV